jgi:hypothetical protein
MIYIHPPKQVEVVMYNGLLVTTVVFDVEVMILSQLSDPELKKEEHFADILGMFTGKDTELSPV